MKLRKLKDRLNSLTKKSMQALKRMLSFAIDYTLALAAVIMVTVCALKLPEMHNKFLHYKVGSKVYTIRDSAKSGGGTGFSVQAPSGISYILTNDHVCDVSSDGQTVLVTGDDVNMRRRIIAHDENSDLCLIEGIPGVQGLEVSENRPSRGDTIYVVGHPHLLPTHVSEGEVTGAQTVQILIAPISYIHPNTGEEEIVSEEDGGMAAEQCTMNKHSQEYVNLNFGFFMIRVKFCVLTVKDAYITSATIFPGNSGSPMVDAWGNVEGVAFASDSTNWGRMVPLKDIKAFLRSF